MFLCQGYIYFKYLYWNLPTTEVACWFCALKEIWFSRAMDYDTRHGLLFLFHCNFKALRALPSTAVSISIPNTVFPHVAFTLISMFIIEQKLN